MLFGDITKGSYDFLGGSEVEVPSKIYQFVIPILTLEKGKLGVCVLLGFVLEHSTLFTSGLTMASYSLHMY
jgi:hypothetical protein